MFRFNAGFRAFAARGDRELGVTEIAMGFFQAHGPAVLLRSALLFVLAGPSLSAHINPRYAKNITLYHVNERNYSTKPIDMNTADINGDMYFDLRSRGLPLECGPWINESFWSRLDCSNPEVADVSKLAITKLVLEVDTRFGDYADCNVDPDTGVYSCACENVPDNCTALTPHGKRKCEHANGCDWDDADQRCEPYGCPNITSQIECVHGYHKCAWNHTTSTCHAPPGPAPVCNRSLVGSLNLSTVNWGQHPRPGQKLSTIDFWHGNALTKTYGTWYSTWAEGQCRPDDPSQAFCGWRLVQTTDKIAKTCSDAAINGVIMAGDASAPWGARCFVNCSAADRRNTSSECYIRCFYANVLGPHGSSRLMNHTSENFGIPLAELQAAWERPFLPLDQGGCPRLGSSHHLPFSRGSEACTGFGCAELTLTDGTLRGNAWKDGNEYLAVRYAKAKRFAPPVITPLTSGVHDATNILGDGHDACLQGPYTNNTLSYGVEDCLILNLYTPGVRSAKATGRPILIWIFGGDNTASEIIPYNATKLAGLHNAIVAVVSYRLGALGFAAFEEDAASGQATGNHGMQDILTAVRWLQREALSMGADPNRIVAFGESSGATDAQLLTMIPEARGLIHGSIGESGGLYAQSLSEAIENTRSVAHAVGCSGHKGLKECMSRKSGAELVNASTYLRWGPTVDGTFLPEQPSAALAAGRLNPGVSVLWGANTNDSAHPYQLRMYVSEQEYVHELNRTLHGEGSPSAYRKVGSLHHQRVREQQHRGAHVLQQEGDDLLRRALALYPPRSAVAGASKNSSNNAALVGWFQSDQFLCSTRRDVLAASRAVSGGGLSFMYRFDWFFQSSSTCIADSNWHTPASGSNHCDEMTFVFGQPIFDNQDPPGYSYTNCSDPASVYYDPDRCTGCHFHEKEAAFALAIGEFWTSFAARGEPSAARGTWPAFTASAPRNIVLHPNDFGIETNLGRAEACVLWDEAARRLGATPHTQVL